MAHGRVVADLAERHGGTLVGAATAVTGGVLTVVEGLDPTTVSVTGILAVAMTGIGWVIRSQAQEVRSLRRRVAELEAREDRRLDALETERAELLDRVRSLEETLARSHGDGR